MRITGTYSAITTLLALFLTLALGASSAPKTGKAIFDKENLPNTNPTYSFPSSTLTIYDSNKKVKSSEGFVKLNENKEAAWILKGIKSGNYHLGVYLSVSRNIGSYGPKKYVLFHNGQKIYFSKTSSLIKVGREHVAEFISENALPLKNGDELRVRKSLKGCLVGSLNLYSSKPKHGIFSIFKGVSSDPFTHDLFRLSVKLKEAHEFNQKAMGEISVFNALPSPKVLNINLKVLNYFMTPVFEFKETVKVESKGTFTKKFEYPWGKSDRYMALLNVRDEQGNRKEVFDQILTPSKSKFRSKLWINKNWDFKAVKDECIIQKSQSESGKWEKINLPFRCKGKGVPGRLKKKFKGINVFWFRKTFTIPPWMKKNDRFFLTFTQIGYDAEIWINAKKVHYQYSPHAPCRLEITKYIDKNAINEILVGARDEVASLHPKELSKGKSVRIRRYAPAIAPHGSTGIDETYIESIPETYIDDSRVLTSFRNKEVKVSYDLKDLQNKKYSLDSAIYFKGEKVFTFKNREFEVFPSKKNVNITVSGKWTDPILWSPWEPNLLRLKTELKTGAGKTLDIKNTRFGFREIWTKDMALIINGTRIKLASVQMSDFSSRKNYRNYIKRGKRIELTGKVHMYSGPLLQDINDEEGIFSFLNSTGICSCTRQRYECDEYWKNAEKWALDCVKAYWNHPSVLVWELSNEFAREDKLAVRRLQKLGEAVKKVDSSRMISFACDLDLKGWNNHINTHYPVERLGLKLNEVYLPDSARWYPVEKELKKGMSLPCGQIKSVANIMTTSPIKWGNKPILVNETGNKFKFFPPHGMASVVGDWAYRGVAEAMEAHITINRWFLTRHRDVEASSITPWLWVFHDPYTRIIPQIDIVPLQAYSRWYAGENVPLTVNLHWDKPKSKRFTFSYTIINNKNGTSLLEETEELDFQPAELKRKKLNIKIPELDEDQMVRLVFELTDEEGNSLKREIIDAKIFANKNRFFTNDSIILFDPKKKSSTLLKAAGVAFQTIEKISQEILAGKKILIVGEDAAQNKIIKENTKTIENFVTNGGTVLILKQSDGKINWTPIQLSVIPDKKTSISFKRAPNHPILKGLDAEDLKFWYPKHLVSQADYKKPSRGNFIPLLDSGTGPSGMEFCPLLEIPWGKGCYVASQIEFNAGETEPAPKTKEQPSWLAELFGSGKQKDPSNFGKNPIAEKLLYNILNYLETYRGEPAVLGAVLKSGGDVEKKLNSLGVEYKTASSKNLKDFSVVFVEMAALDKNMAELLKIFAKDGGTLLLHKVDLKSKDLANLICDDKLLLFKDFHPMLTGRLLKITNAEIIDGLGNADFYWKKLPITQSYEASYSTPSWAKELILEHPFDLIDGEVFTFPAAIGQLKVGNGTVIIDQINWETPNSSVIKESDRIASTLFTQLACPIKKASKLNLEIPEDLKYTPLNISKYLNRSLSDKVANDGEGGWTDQGPEADFSKLKPGLKKYNGVPFKIEKGKSCLVLRSKNRRPTVPEKVLGIPVAKKADLIYFLQSSAWTKKNLGLYRIHYANGESFDIPLADGINMRDWGKKYPDKPFYNETTTKTQRAFSFHSFTMPKKRSIFMMAWFNPHPKLEIKSFDFISANEGVPILLAVTVANEPKVAADIEIVKGDRKKAFGLVEKANKAFKNKQDKEGEELLLKAIKADNSCEEAHARLGRLYFDQGKLKKAEKEFRISLAINEEDFDVYLMLGEILEKQKRYKDALRVYQKSNEIDNNQPRVIAGMKQMHDILDKKKKRRK